MPKLQENKPRFGDYGVCRRCPGGHIDWWNVMICGECGEDWSETLVARKNIDTGEWDVKGPYAGVCGK